MERTHEGESRWLLATVVLLIGGLVILTSPLWPGAAALRARADGPAAGEAAVAADAGGWADLAISQAGTPQRRPGRLVYTITVQNLGDGDAEYVTGTYRCVDGRAVAAGNDWSHEFTLGPLARGAATTQTIECPTNIWATTDTLQVRVDTSPEQIMANNSLDIGEVH